MRRFVAALSVAILGSACTPAPPPAPEPPPPSTAVRDSLRGPYDSVKNNVIKALPLVPDNRLNFRPTPDVRTMGQLFGHIANANYSFCSVATGAKPEDLGDAETLETKDELARALADSFAFCDAAFDGVNDQTGAEAVTIGFINDMPTTKLGVLAFNTAHDWEHYGNLVTYLRLNRIVPPSSQPQP